MKVKFLISLVVVGLLSSCTANDMPLLPEDVSVPDRITHVSMEEASKRLSKFLMAVGPSTQCITILAKTLNE